MSADLIFHRVFKLSRFTSSLKYFKPSLVFPSRVSAVSISFSTETRAPEATHYRWSFQFGWMDSRAIDGVAFHRPHALFSECLQVELLTSGVSQHISHVKCVHYILERACWYALYLAAIPPTPVPLSPTPLSLLAWMSLPSFYLRRVCLQGWTTLRHSLWKRSVAPGRDSSRFATNSEKKVR